MLLDILWKRHKHEHTSVVLQARNFLTDIFLTSLLVERVFTRLVFRDSEN